MREYYLDNASTTSITDEVFQDILPYLRKNYGNPSSLHKLGTETRNAINKARTEVARYINAKPQEIYFTSGGSEANTWALMGIAPYLKEQGKTHIITSSIEHSSILNTCKELEKQGFNITYINPDEDGIISEKDIEQYINSETGLVSIMSANNEIGTIQPILKIGQTCHDYGVLFHTDGVQALEDVKLNMTYNLIDMMSMSAHKVHGLKGCGALYVHQGINLTPLIYGGGQEKGWRAGTENVLGIVSFGSALSHLKSTHIDNVIQRAGLRDMLIDKLFKIPNAYLNGSHGKRLSGNINFSFKGIEGEALMLRLNRKGIYVSTGSACHSGSLNPSHVLTAIGVPDDLARGSIRLSISEDLYKGDILYIAEMIAKEVKFLRNIC